MTPAKLYVSATQEDGSFLVRGMASLSKTLDIFRTFRDTRPGGRAVFALFSQHDGRVRLRPSTADLFEAEVIARVARTASFFGCLPAKPEIALRRMDFTADNAESVITALYTLGRTPFRHLVQQEIDG